MWIKVVVIILMLAILFSLFRGLFFLAKGGGEENSKKMLKSLTWRIGLSLALFIALMLLDYFDVINLREGVLPVDTTQEAVVNEPKQHP